MARSSARRGLHRPLPRTSVALVAFVAVGGASAAHAQSSTKSCVVAYEAEQRLAEAGDLLGAREKLYECGASDCPAALQRECIDSIAALEPRIPTVILAARDAAGHDLVDVRVLLDGAAWKPRVDGRETGINPGPHTVRFIAPDLAPVDVSIVAREREKGRLVQATLGAMEVTRREPPPGQSGASSSRPGRAVPALAWALGGVAVAGIGTYAYFLSSALSQRSQVGACTPSCGETLRDDINHKLLAADVSWIVALVAAGGATLLYLVTRQAGPPAAAWAQGARGLVAW